ncbi:MAG: ATP synthase F1 subunit gamma [bacterium]|nr:ATP synthase F1 subunit gamma [bacterium]MDZ4284558.1 ATP synthase F1 subunit gamma [Patescibacteria group bacterium]
MSSGKQLKTRIRSVGNIRKITKAMELVSVSKMKRAVDALLRTRPYAEGAWEVLRDLRAVALGERHPLLGEERELKRALVLLTTSDRGLCANFNSAVLGRVEKFLAELPEGASADIVTLGKRGREAAARRGWNLVASFDHLSVLPSAEDIEPIATLLTRGFIEGRYDHIYIVFTDFVSAIRQEVALEQLLPLHENARLGAAWRVGEGAVNTTRALARERLRRIEFLFEPSGKAVFEYVLPRLVSVQIFQGILESIASEHAARRLAMKNATDAAADIVRDVTFTFNQMRQSAITQEIAEISTGAMMTR